AWTSSISVFLRGTGGSDYFSILSGATWDFSGATISYTVGTTTWNNVCLAENGGSGGVTNTVNLYAGATLNLFGNAVLNSSLIAYFQGTTIIDTIGTHAGAATAYMVMNNANALLEIGRTGFGRLSQNTNVTWNAGQYYASVAFNAGSWSINNWNFGNSN